VAASLARKMGSYLLTQTMSRRHQLSMDSYDRLFPNQDTLPRGGFGTLIALPLQDGPRQERVRHPRRRLTHPSPDQWAFRLHSRPKKVEKELDGRPLRRVASDLPVSLAIVR